LLLFYYIILKGKEGKKRRKRKGARGELVGPSRRCSEENRKRGERRGKKPSIRVWRTSKKEKGGKKRRGGEEKLRDYLLTASRGEERRRKDKELNVSLHLGERGGRGERKKEGRKGSLNTAPSLIRLGGRRKGKRKKEGEGAAGIYFFRVLKTGGRRGKIHSGVCPSYLLFIHPKKGRMGGEEGGGGEKRKGGKGR